MDEKLLRSRQMEFKENWVCRNRERVQDGYIASTQVSFMIEDFKLYKSLWMAFAKMGDVSVQNVSYGLKDRRAAEDALKVAAVKDAQKKARVLTDAMEVKLGAPVMIQEQGAVSSLPEARMLSYGAGDPFADESGGDAAVAAGEIELSASVHVSFKILP